MTFPAALILKILLVLGAGIAGYMTPRLLKKNDTAFEQIFEKIIEEQTGHEIDFSPEEDNKKK